MYRKPLSFPFPAALFTAITAIGFVALPAVAQDDDLPEVGGGRPPGGQGAPVGQGAPAGQQAPVTPQTAGARDYSKIQAAGLLATGQPVTNVSFSPNGEIVAALTLQQVHLWNTTTGTALKPLASPQGFFRAMAWSPDGKALATGGGGQAGAISVWDVQATNRTQTFAPNLFITALVFSPDGKWLAGAANDNKVRIWNVENGQEMGVVEGPQFPVTEIAFSPNGHFLYTAGGGTGKMLETTEPEGPRRPGGPDAGEGGGPGMPGLPLGNYEGLSEFIAWSVQDGQRVQQVTFPDGGPGVAFSPDKKQLMIVGSGAIVKRPNVNPNAPLRARMPKTFWSTDTVRVWRVPENPAAENVNHMELMMPDVLKNPDPPVREKVAVAWAPDGKARVIDNMLWDGGITARPLPQGNMSEFTAMAFSPDGRFLAGGGAAGVQIWAVPE